MTLHTTLGPLASIEGHTPDGRYYTLYAADVDVKPGWLFWPADGEVARCVLYKNSPDLVHDENGKLDLVYPTKTRPLTTPSLATRLALDRTYTLLHEERGPGSYWTDRPRVGSNHAQDALVIDAVSYVKQTNDSPGALSLYLYRHPIELSENQKPTLAISKNQELWFRNQHSVRVTERGIEDMPSDIKRSSDSRPNPYTQENIKRALVSSAYAGVAGLGWSMLVNAGIEMLPANIKTYTTGYMGAGLKVIAGVLVAVGIDGMLDTEEQRKQYGAIAAGIGVGGVIGGGMQAYDTYKVNNPSATAADTTAIPASFPSAAAYDQFRAAHPTLNVPTSLRPPAGFANRPPFGQSFSGVNPGTRRAA